MKKIILFLVLIQFSLSLHIVLHGFGGGCEKKMSKVEYLRSQGYEADCLETGKGIMSGFKKIEKQAEIACDYVNATYKNKEITFVAFSQGGSIAIELLSNCVLQNNNTVVSLITFGSPLAGTNRSNKEALKYYCALLNSCFRNFRLAC